MTTNLIWILYRSDSDTAYKETLNCKKIIEGYGKKVLFSEIKLLDDDKQFGKARY